MENFTEIPTYQQTIYRVFLDMPEVILVVSHPLQTQCHYRGPFSVEGHRYGDTSRKGMTESRIGSLNTTDYPIVVSTTFVSEVFMIT